MDKHERYRKRKYGNGQCTRCGKPSDIYTNCDECREKKRANYRKNKAKKGYKRGPYAITDIDARILPRINYFPPTNKDFISGLMAHLPADKQTDDAGIDFFFLLKKIRKR